MKASNTIPVVPKKVLIPFILLTSLFALWGFANAVTDPMVQAFKKVLELSNSQAAWQICGRSFSENGPDLQVREGGHIPDQGSFG